MKRTLMVSAVLLASGTAAIAQDADMDAASNAATATATFVTTTETEHDLNVGDLTLTQTESGVHITGDLTGLTEGPHGFHIHAVGKCDEGEEFESAGGHFNPTDNQHGLDNPEGPHAGDMENLMVSADGEVSVDVTNENVSLNEGDEGYLLDDDGSAFVIHEDEDDQMTDPGGNSGARFACAVIKSE